MFFVGSGYATDSPGNTENTVNADDNDIPGKIPVHIF
jgi:hypothetical protein